MATLKKQIMRRIYLIWCVRQIFTPITLKLFILLGLSFQVGRYISLENIFVNMQSYSISGLYQFFASAFLNTELTVQATIFVGGILAIFLARDIFASKVKRGAFLLSSLKSHS